MISPKRFSSSARAQGCVVGAQLVEHHGVAHEQRGLGGEDGHRLEHGRLEQVHDAIAADVDEPEQLAGLGERHAHHRQQLEVHDRHGGLELVVVERVADDDRLLLAHHLGDDAVGEL